MNVDKWNDIVNKYNDTYYSRIRIKPVDVEPITYIGFGLENNNDIDRKFKVCDHIRIIKHKTFLQKVTYQVGLKKILWLRKLNTLFCGNMILLMLTVKKLI